MATNKVIFGNQVLIDLTLDNIDETKVVSGTIFHKPNGEKTTGNMRIITSSDFPYPLQGNDQHLKSKNQILEFPAGYYPQPHTVSLWESDQNALIGSNIRKGVDIFGIMGKLQGCNAGTFVADTGKENSIFDIDTGLDSLSMFVAYFSNNNVASGTARQRAYIQWNKSASTIYDGTRSLISTSNAQSCTVIHHALGTRITYMPSINAVSGGKITIQMPANIGYIKGTWTYIAVGD